MTDKPVSSSASAAKPKVTVYWLNESRAQRILFLLEELHVDYDVKIFKRQAMRAPPELKKIHPLGKSPIVTLEYPGEEPLVLAESGFVVQQLVSRFSTPANDLSAPSNNLTYQYFTHFAEGSLMPPLVVSLLLNLVSERSPFFIKPIANMITNGLRAGFVNPEVKNLFGFLNATLEESVKNGGEWICGKEFSGADCLLLYPIEASKGRVGADAPEKYPEVYRYLERLQKRPAYARATERAQKAEEEAGVTPSL